MSTKRRSSGRWSLNGRPDFKEMCNGKKSDNSSKTISVGQASHKKGMKNLLWEGMKCQLYEEVMRHMREYEKQFDCKLNASMVTLKLRQGRPDFLYYRSITFWCSYCIQGGKPFMSPSLGLAQRFCPFLVVVNGDSIEEALVITQIYPHHQHLPHISSEVSSVEAAARPFTASPVPPNPSHTVTVPLIEADQSTKKPVKKSVSPPGFKKAVVTQNVKPTTVKRRHNSSSSGAEDSKRPASASHVISKKFSYTHPRKLPISPPIAHQTKTSQNSKSADEVDEDVLPNNLKCQLCNFQTRSKNSFCGHVWLVHKLLTDFIAF